MDAARRVIPATAFNARLCQTGSPCQHHDRRGEQSGAPGELGAPRDERAQVTARGLGRGGPPPAAGAPHALTPSAPQAVVGDSEYHHFRYRIPPARVRLLEVGGDLQLQSVKIF